MFKKIGVLGIAFVLLLTLLSRLTLAQSSAYLESRISRLESDSFQIRSELSRLESQVYQFANRSNYPPASRNVSPPPPVSPRATRLRPEPTYDRLATLFIELRERVNKLEARLKRLER